MSFRVAFCGPNVEDNVELARFSTTLDVPTMRATILADPRLVVAPKVGDQDEDWLNLWSATWGRIRQMELNAFEFIVSSTCGLDQVCAQALRFGQRVQEAESGIQVTDQQILAQKAAVIHRAGSILQVILNQTEEEVSDWWSFVYYKPPVEHDELADFYEQFIRGGPAFQSIVTLPRSIDDALQVVESQAQKWSVP